MPKMKAGSPFLYDAVTGDIVGIKDADGGEFLFNGIPSLGSNGTNWVYNGDSTLQSYVTDTGWTVEYTYNEGKVATITFSKAGETTRVQTYTWSGEQITSIVTN